MLREGHILWLKFRFNNRPGDISTKVHPYVVYKIDTKLNCVEIIQCDSYDNKPHKAYMKENLFIAADEESVFNEHGYAQLDNCFTVELSDELENYMRTEDTMSSEQFLTLKAEYLAYQLKYPISENKTVYLSIQELKSINS